MKNIYIVCSWIIFFFWRYFRKPKIVSDVVHNTLGILMAIIFSEESFEAIKGLAKDKITKASTRGKNREIRKFKDNVAWLEQYVAELKKDTPQFPDLLSEAERKLELAKSLLTALQSGERNIFAEGAFLREPENRKRQ